MEKDIIASEKMTSTISKRVWAKIVKLPIGDLSKESILR